MVKEYQRLTIAGTFGATYQPVGLNVISSKGMFAWRSNDAVQAKARLVTRGFKQHEGIDVNETFALKPAASCFHLWGASACKLGLHLCPSDSEQAFADFGQ